MSKPWKARGIFNPGTQVRSREKSKKSFRLGTMLDVVEAVIPKTDTIIDIGAQSGHVTRRLKDLGYDIIGIDGTPGIDEISDGLVKECDITTLKPEQSIFNADWGIFINVGEHVPVELESLLVEGVSSIPRVGLMVAWADQLTPDKKVYNRRPDYYVASIFGHAGWVVNEELTEKSRKIVGDYSRMNERLLVMLKDQT
jgi:hypothetical protein